MKLRGLDSRLCMAQQTGTRIDWRILMIVAAGLLLAFPCLLYGFPFYGDDSISNVVLFKQFSQQFRTGELYPRWLQQLNGGLGNPTAFYYAPAAYWITSLLDLASDHSGWKQLGWSAALAVVGSGLTAFLWLRKSLPRNPALLASLIYLVAPYHVNIDLYHRAALAELWTFVWMPLVLWSIDLVMERRRFAVVCLAVSYALLIVTHLPTTLIFSLVPVGSSLYVADTSVRLRSFITTVLGMTLGIGLASVYLLPAMTMQQFIFHTTQGIAGHYYFGNWFLFDGIRWSGRWAEHFWAATAVAALGATSFAIAWSGSIDRPRRKILFWLAVAVCSFFMMTPPSKPVWELLPTLQKVQFPFRFNTVLTVSAAALAGFAFDYGRKSPRLFLSSVIVLLMGIWLYSTFNRAYYDYPVHHLDQNVMNWANKRLQLKRDTDEFRPRWVVSTEEEELDALLAHIGTTEGELTKVNVIQGQATITVNKWLPREINLTVDSASGATLNVSQFYFPGWAVRFDDIGEAKALEPSKPGGLIRVSAPAGRHTLSLQLTKRWPERAGELISLGALVVLLGLLIVGKRFGI